MPVSALFCGLFRSVKPPAFRNSVDHLSTRSTRTRRGVEASANASMTARKHDVFHRAHRHRNGRGITGLRLRPSLGDWLGVERRLTSAGCSAERIFG